MNHHAKRNPAIFIIGLVIMIILLVPISWVYIISDGHPYSMFLINKTATAHLEDRGYSKDDMFESHYVHENNMGNNNYCKGQYMVVFQDELDVVYYYGVTKDNHEVVQLAEKEITLENEEIEFTSKHTKHTEEHCVESKEVVSQSHH